MDNSGYESWQDTKARMLANFSQWLDELNEPPQIIEEKPQMPDLFSFYGELAALKQEINLQSRESRQLSETVKSTTETLEKRLEVSAGNVAHLADDVKAQLPKARQEASRAVVAEILPILEGIERSVAGIEKVEVPSLVFGDKKERLRDNFSAPVKNVAAKCADFMHRLKIEPVAEEGVVFNAEYMRVVGTVTKGVSGTVSEVVAQGYLFNNELIKTAEVKVVK